MADSKDNKATPSFADAAAAAKAAKAAKKAQAKKDRAADTPHVSGKAGFASQSHLKNTKGFAPRVQSRAVKG